MCILVTHYWNFSKFKGHNSAENYSTRPKFKLNLRILLTHLFTELQFQMSISNGDNERKLKINGIFLSPRGITLPKIIRPNPNSNSTCVFSWTHLYPEFQFQMSIRYGDNERKLKINGIFLSPRGITLPKIIRPKFTLNLHIFVTHLYPEFQFKMSICNGDNERKLKSNGIFLSSRGITLPKINPLNPNSNSTCVFSWHIYIQNFNSKLQFVMEIMSGNWKVMEFFYVQGT